jgi:hypothetical protein
MAYTDREDVNYAGMLFYLGKTRTPLLSRILRLPVSALDFNLETAIQAGIVRTVNSPYFSTAQPVAMGAPTQPSISEASSIAPVADTITRGQDTNVTQIHQYLAEVTYMKQSSNGERSGLNTNEPINPTDELGFQVSGHLLQIALDLDKSLVAGSYAAPSTSATAGKTRGLSEAIATNTVAAGTAQLSKTMIDNLVGTMAGNGAILQDLVMLANAYQMKKINDIYGNPNMSLNVGGTQIITIYTPYGAIEVMYEPNVATSEIDIVEASICKLVIQPVNGRYIIVEDKQIVGAALAKHVYMQAGFDYGAEEMHGKITGLATS